MDARLQPAAFIRTQTKQSWRIPLVYCPEVCGGSGAYRHICQTWQPLFHWAEHLERPFWHAPLWLHSTVLQSSVYIGLNTCDTTLNRSLETLLNQKSQHFECKTLRFYRNLFHIMRLGIIRYSYPPIYLIILIRGRQEPYVISSDWAQSHSLWGLLSHSLNLMLCFLFGRSHFPFGRHRSHRGRLADAALWWQDYWGALDSLKPWDSV